MDPIDELKRDLRERMKAARRALSDEAVARMATDAAERVLALPEVREARLVCCYVSVRRELPTQPLLQALMERHIPVAVPRVGEGMLHAHLVTDLDALIHGAFGVPTSDGPEVTEDVDVCITPGLAFTPDGHRLGYGGGYYDRFLSAHPHLHPIGLAYDAQVIDQLPIDLHDHPMAAVATPTRVLRCA